ncbi:MAG: hypothetical protein ACM31C_08485 [Acidobacteriota bacterium]
MTAVWIDGARFELSPATLVGQGGEAEIYDLGDGRVVKWWKPVGHPDFAGLPDAQAAAAQRLAERPAKLRALPGNLPGAVVAPCGFALAGKKSPQVVGYVMPKVAGEPLCSYGELRWRREHPVDGEDLVAVLLALHDALAGLHRTGVVVGDCNDLNVLVAGRRVHLIDVDSYQFGGFACPMFSERFVDPRLCDARLVPVHPHDTHSDWFAFAAMVLRTLLGVGPWGGVAQQCTAGARALRRLSVLGDAIVYPRAARPPTILPNELVATLRAIFERDERGVFPRAQLERLHLRACPRCGEEHARARCPACQVAQPPLTVRGKLRVEVIAHAQVALASVAVGRTPVRGVRLDGPALLRDTRLGPERIGAVLAQHTRAWVGERMGVGFYRAGGYAVGFVFDPPRGPLDDRVALPPLRGQLVDAHAVLGTDRAWLAVTCTDRGRLVTTLLVIGRDARVLACDVPADAAWLAGFAGACADGPHLFVPTDDGIVRVEVAQGAPAVTRVFAETCGLVTACDRLALHPTGIDVVRKADALRLHLA